MSKIYNFFSDSYYINLDKREDRRKKFEERIKKVNITSNRFSAIHPEISECTHVPYWNEQKTDSDKRRKANEVGCALSHVSIIKEAKKRQLDNVLIFEDDCVFSDDFEIEVKKVIEDIKKYNIEWDVLYFGGEPNDICTKITDNVYTIEKGGIYGLQSYAVNSSFYDTIIDMDFTFCSIIDIFILNYDSEKRKYILSKKLLTQQETNYSDLRDQIVETPHFVNGWNKYVK